MTWLMTKVNSKFPITSNMAEKALYFLAQKHPLLRMTIQRDANGISFHEMDNLRLDFSVSCKQDWLRLVLDEVSNPFDIVNGPLWRCKHLTSPPRMHHQLDQHGSTSTKQLLWKNPLTSCDIWSETTFLFVLHHSIMDGKYFLLLFKHFAEVLNNLDLGNEVRHGVKDSLPLLPPVEDFIVCPPPQIRKSEKSDLKSQSSIHVDLSDQPTKVLEDYNRRYYHEIQNNLSNNPRSRCLVGRFTKHDTTQIMHTSKNAGASANGAFIAASLLAFIDLVYPASSLQKEFNIPFEFMLDLRRYCSFKFSKHMKCFPGVAAIHIPMMAELKLTNRTVTKREFLEMSRLFGSAIQNEVQSQETYQWVRKTVKESKEADNGTINRKSPTVLCISNMGCLDNVLEGDITERIRLTELHGQSTVLIEDSPIFFISVHSLNGIIYFSVSFCENYTSVQTAEEYMAYFQKYLVSLSKPSAHL